MGMNLNAAGRNNTLRSDVAREYEREFTPLEQQDPAEVNVSNTSPGGNVNQSQTETHRERFVFDEDDFAAGSRTHLSLGELDSVLFEGDWTQSDGWDSGRAEYMNGEGATVVISSRDSSNEINTVPDSDDPVEPDNQINENVTQNAKDAEAAAAAAAEAIGEVIDGIGHIFG